LAATIKIAGKDTPFALLVRQDAADRFFYELNSLRRGGGGEAAQQVASKLEASLRQKGPISTGRRRRD